MMLSTDQLCTKMAAPPTVHGIALRVLSDGYLAKGDSVKEAKDALEKGLGLCKVWLALTLSVSDEKQRKKGGTKMFFCFVFYRPYN